MSLATDFLAEVFARKDYNQSDFARACGMTPTNVTDLLKGDVAISGRNLTKLLRGLRTEKDRLDFLTAYLCDQVPADYADEISIRLTAPAAACGMVMESSDPANELEAQLILAFSALPSDLYRRRLLRLTQTLRKDADLRDLFARTMAYLEEQQGSGLSSDTLKSTLSPKELGAAAAAGGKSAKRALSKGGKRKTPPPQTRSAPGSGGASGS